MTTCKACGNEFRKGVLVTLLTPKGIRGARVCQSCANGGMIIVAQKVAPVIEQKVVRAPEPDRIVRMLKTYASAALAAASKEQPETGGEHEFFKGRAEGIETAIEVIKKELVTS
jgi:hypothetical protein